MIKNMCVKYDKLQSRVFRDTTAKINEKRYLDDEIRRAYAGGQKFHPYL